MEVNPSALPLNLSELFDDNFVTYGNYKKQKISKLHQAKIDNYQLYDDCIREVKLDGMELQYVIFQDEAICLEAVKSNPNALQFVFDKTFEICKVAIAQNSFMIKYILKSHPNYEELCELASQKTGYSLKVMKIQTPQICINAIEKDLKSGKYVKIFTNEVFDRLIEQRLLLVNV